MIVMVMLVVIMTIVIKEDDTSVTTKHGGVDVGSVYRNNTNPD